jgi:hypothetical protein
MKMISEWEIDARIDVYFIGKKQQASGMDF